MKVFLLVDMEGATGIVNWPQVRVDSPEYVVGQKLLMSDVNAAVEGILEAGAKEVVVCEGHAHMRNIILEQLNERARLITGPAKYKEYCQIIGLDDSFDAAVFVGFHAKARVKQALLSHTWTGTVHHVKVNGAEFGETGLNAAICGAYNVPLFAITGDNAVCQEAKDTVGNHVHTIEVKKALSYNVGECFTPKATAKMIRQGMVDAFKLPHPVLQISSPVTIELGFYKPENADQASRFPHVERIEDSEVRICHESYLEAIKITWQAIIQAELTAPAWMT